MPLYPVRALERAMKISEVITRAISGKINWIQAAEILGMSDRQLRRWRGNWAKYGYNGLFDRRTQRPSPKRVPLADVEKVLRLYREKYFDLNVKHFVEKLHAEEHISLSYTWVKIALWIGWDFRTQYGRLKLIANNSRFLILPGWHLPNVGSRVLSLTERRVVSDWRTRFGHPLLLLETFVDPRRFYGGVYRAANWIELGLTQGYRRTRAGYSAQADCSKRVFVRSLCRDAREQLNCATRDLFQLTGGPRIMPNAQQMRQLPQCFKTIPAPRRAQVRRHPLSVVLGIAAGATLCGIRAYKGITDWAQSLGTKARERFGCRRENGRYVVPSEFVIRDCMIRIEPGTLDLALNTWNQAWGAQDEALAM